MEQFVLIIREVLKSWQIGKLEGESLLTFDRFEMRIGGVKRMTRIKSTSYGLSHAWGIAYLPSVNMNFFM